MQSEGNRSNNSNPNESACDQCVEISEENNNNINKKELSLTTIGLVFFMFVAK